MWNLSELGECRVCLIQMVLGKVCDKWFSQQITKTIFVSSSRIVNSLYLTFKVELVTVAGVYVCFWGPVQNLAERGGNQVVWPIRSSQRADYDQPPRCMLKAVEAEKLVLIFFCVVYNEESARQEISRFLVMRVYCGTDFCCCCSGAQLWWGQSLACFMDLLGFGWVGLGFSVWRTKYLIIMLIFSGQGYYVWSYIIQICICFKFKQAFLQNWNLEFLWLLLFFFVH